MIVIASSNGRIGITESMRILQAGGSALDAVEAGIKLVEADPTDHTVGYSGYPNILGEVELDASIMDGKDLRSGAVGGLKHTLHAISVARAVMEELPHVFLAGEGADRFAKEMGFPASELLSPEAKAAWQARLRAEMSEADFAQLASANDLKTYSDLRTWVRLATDPERTKGTVNFIAQDKEGNIATGVSTSGWAWKYPSRLGDSPVIGAGNYADNRYGAAACTGMGEMAIRACTAHSIIMYLKHGKNLHEACSEAMSDLRHLGGKFIAVMNLIALDKDGNHAGYSSQTGRSYIVFKEGMNEPEEIARTIVDVPYRWEGAEVKLKENWQGLTE